MKDVGIVVPEIYFPNKNVDLNKFSVVACDQYSAEPEYWNDVKNHIGNNPSAYNMILPEAYLGKDINRLDISDVMQKYLNDNTLVNLGKGFMLVHRETSSGIRKGLVVAFDLEKYDYSKDSKSIIRATERTVKERLPERIKIRKSATFEMPHVMVLINDMQNKLFSYLDSYSKNNKPFYDFNLYPSKQNIKGWFIKEADIWDKIADILDTLYYKDILFAMGDGNHSFAAAKEHYINTGKDRYALAEIVNLYDDALLFEPIHRLVYNTNVDKLINDLHLDIKNPPSLQELQPKLDEWLSKNGGELEYIHGADNCQKLAKEKNGLAICWKKFPKESLFADVDKNGVLCRKSFSMGHAEDKRYYLECQRINCI